MAAAGQVQDEAVENPAPAVDGDLDDRLELDLASMEVRGFS